MQARPAHRDRESTGIMVSDNIDLEWLSYPLAKEKRNPRGLADARVDGKLVLGNITIISVVSCTTVLMVCMIFLFGTRIWSGNGVDIQKQDDVRGSAKEG